MKTEAISVEAYKVVELIKSNLRFLIKLHPSKVGAAYVRQANNSVICFDCKSEAC